MTGDPPGKTTSQIRFAGEGGQGLVLVGMLLAEAAALEGREAAQSARYGAAMRGGVTLADVVIASIPIDFPHVEDPDYLVVMSQVAYDLLAPEQKPGSRIFYDTFFVEPREIPAVEHLAVAATDKAIQKFGHGQGANLIILGSLVQTSGLVGGQSLRRAVEQSTSGARRRTNLEAISLARKIAPSGAGGSRK
jgi:2-oxoglutarate ferredoxin oxidoreductase subunit gamma